MSKTCKTCVHWMTEGSGAGFCRRFPPQVIPRPTPQGAFMTETHWPVTGSDQTCGEHILVPREWSALNRTTRS
jgi:hypothetical protein